MNYDINSRDFLDGAPAHFPTYKFALIEGKSITLSPTLRQSETGIILKDVSGFIRGGVLHIKGTRIYQDVAPVKLPVEFLKYVPDISYIKYGPLSCVDWILRRKQPYVLGFYIVSELSLSIPYYDTFEDFKLFVERQ